jgi:hypothetical protein
MLLSAGLPGDGEPLSTVRVYAAGPNTIGISEKLSGSVQW